MKAGVHDLPGSESAEKSAERVPTVEQKERCQAPGPEKSPQDPPRASELSLGLSWHPQLRPMLSRYQVGGGSATYTFVIAVSGAWDGGCIQALILGTPGQTSARVAAVNSS